MTVTKITKIMKENIILKILLLTITITNYNFNYFMFRLSQRAL